MIVVASGTMDRLRDWYRELWYIFKADHSTVHITGCAREYI